MKFFITGTAGFIGFHLARHLLNEGHTVHGYDGMTPYYDLSLKKARLDILKSCPEYHHVEAMLEDSDALLQATRACSPDAIIHLAAQAGVRYSLDNPRAYIDSNLVGSFNVLEAAREVRPKHLMLASTSSVYGANKKIPFEEIDKTDEPLTIYAATKKSMEVMAHAYAHLWKIPTTAFRFFTVYGPYGRPDMALFKFIKASENDETIDVYGEGNQERDFTYIDDLIAAIALLINTPPIEDNRVPSTLAQDSMSMEGPFRVVNIGGGNPVGLLPFIKTIEDVVGKPLRKNMLPMQKGDVPRTYANSGLLRALTAFTPRVDVQTGVKAFFEWYKAFTKTGADA